MIKDTNRSVKNCPITSLRFELLKSMAGGANIIDEKKFLESFIWMVNRIANKTVPADIFDRINYTLAGQKKMDELLALVAHAFM